MIALQPGMEPGGIEEGDRIANPKAPSMPRAPPVCPGVKSRDNGDKCSGAVGGRRSPDIEKRDSCNDRNQDSTIIEEQPSPEFERCNDCGGDLGIV